MRNSLLLAAILLLAAAGLAGAQPPTAGPSAYWTFDEISGISVYDRGPGANVGTLFNDAHQVPGRVGQALAFGPHGFMEVEPAPQLDLTRQWSIDFWLLLPEGGTRDGFIMAKGAFPDSWDMYATHNGALNLRIGGGQASDHVSKPVAIPGQWTHIVWTYDADLPKAGLKLYANGALAQTWDETATVKLTDKPFRVQGPAAIDQLKLFQRPLSAEEIAAEYQAPEKFFGKTVFVATVWPVKLIYNTTEPITIQTAVASLDAQPRQVRADTYVVTGLDRRIPVQDTTLTLAPGEVKSFNLTVKSADVRFGAELVQELYEGQTLVDRKSETFLVSDNPYQVGQKGAACLRGWSDDTVRQQREQVVRLRQYYLPIAELLSVAPDNFSKWIPDTDKWFAGQGGAAYRNSVEAVRALTGDAHKNGIFIVPYVNSAVSGVYGTQFAAEHPDWMLYDARGHITGGVETKMLELEQQFYKQYPASLDDKALLDAIQPDTGAGIQIAAVNNANQDAVRYSIQQIVKGMKYFGFDGLRWDGHYQVAAPSDPAAIGVPQEFTLEGQPAAPDQATADRITAANTKMCKEMIHQEIPWAVFGYNWGLPWKQWGRTRPLDYAECCRGGGMILWESVNGISDATSPWHRWKVAADAIADEAEHPHDNGGFLNVGWFPWWEAKDVYGHHLLAITFAARAHFDGAPGRNPISWLRFAARYSEFLYDLKINRAPDLIPAISVGPGEVWWRKYVYLRQTPQGRQVILHLINPPATDTVEIASTQAPAEQKNVQVTFALPAGYTPRSVYLLSPDLPAFGGKTAFKLAGRTMTITVPSLKYWDMLVMQFN